MKNTRYIYLYLILTSHFLQTSEDSYKSEKNTQFQQIWSAIQNIQNQVTTLSTTTTLTASPSISSDIGIGHSSSGTGSSTILLSTNITESGVTAGIPASIMLITGTILDNLTLQFTINTSGTINATLYVFATTSYTDTTITIQGFAYLTGTVDGNPFIPVFKIINIAP